MRYPAKVTIVEVGPRDGLQNEAVPIATADKIAFVDRLSARSAAGHRGLGVRQPEVGAADGGRGGSVRRNHAAPGTRYTALVPNLAGIERAPRPAYRDRGIRRGLGDLQHAQHQPVHRRVARRLPRRLPPRVRARASACAATCRRRSAVPSRETCRRQVANVSAALVEMGAFEVAVSDTIGIAHPGRSRRSSTSSPAASASTGSRCTSTIRGAPRSPTCSPRLHLGVTTFDASAGGLGGCPYAPGATGNLATEDLVYMLDWARDRDGRRSGRLAPGVGLHGIANRPPPAVALLPRDRRALSPEP